MRDYRCAVLVRSKKPPEGAVALTDVSGIASVAPIYGLVLLAGGFTAGAAPDDYQQMFETNVISNMRAIDAGLPHIEPGGRIVAISSVLSKTHAAGFAAYSASKAALNAAIATLGKELKKREITANALLPSTIDTEAKREVVADAIALLLSPQASAITGQLIELAF